MASKVDKAFLDRLQDSLNKLPKCGLITPPQNTTSKELWNTRYHEFGISKGVIPKRPKINLNPTLFQRIMTNTFDSEFRYWIIFFLSLLISGIIRIIVS